MRQNVSKRNVPNETLKKGIKKNWHPLFHSYIFLSILGKSCFFLETTPSKNALLFSKVFSKAGSITFDFSPNAIISELLFNISVIANTNKLAISQFYFNEDTNKLICGIINLTSGSLTKNVSIFILYMRESSVTVQW